jgi:hypothetical protein
MQQTLSVHLKRGALALLAGVAMSAQAAPVFELTGRQSEVSITNIHSGIGFVGARIDPGMVSSTVLQPATLSLSGSDEDAEAEFFYSTSLKATWSISQTYSVAQVGADTLLRASGALDLKASSFSCNGPSCSTTTDVPYTSTNFQTLEFTLSEAAGFAATGVSAKDQSVSLQRSTDGGQSWADVVGWNIFATYGGSSLLGPQTLTPWSQSGLLDAGLYRVSNGPYAYTNPTYAYTSWDYQFALAGTTSTAPVPEPGSLLLMALGLAGVLAWRCRPAT